MMLVEHVDHGGECILAPVGAPVPHHDSLQIYVLLRLLLVELIYFESEPRHVDPSVGFTR